MHYDTWQLQEAKAKFSQLLDKCQKEPQLVTRHGEAAAYVVSAEQFDKIIGKGKKQKKMTAGEFFRKSPLYDSGITLANKRKENRPEHREVHFDTDGE
jgi:antitoxin Phd